jgi:hypothetical protein
MNNSSVQITIEQAVTQVLINASPIVIDAQLAIPQIGSGNYLLSDLDTNKIDGFLRFAVSKELQFQETGVSKMRGDAGIVTLNLGAADYKITDNGADRFTFSRTSGNFTATGDVAAYSDSRLKYDVKVIESALDKVKKLNGVTFYKYTDPNHRSTGLIAQEVAAVLPEAVRYDEQGYLTVAYGNLVGLLVEAIKELTGVIKNDNKCGCACNEA